MKLHELRPDKGSTKQRKRVGRGHSAGQGKTAGRGTKGQGARSGGGKGPYFEGGQLPLVRRLPFKRGFTNIFRVTYQEVNLVDLARVFSAGDVVTPETMQANGLIKKADAPVVVLGNGELPIALTVSAHRFSKTAQEQIEAAGGSIQTLELLLTGAHATVKKLRKEQVDQLRAERESN
ncbi:MAG: 50S ribosomal protein L15 [Anaerolineae bacterium]|nr:50S ribosomal protein L15 [Anaerolineae bacterium]